MTARDIVRDPSIAGGQWHFAGTAIFIDAVRTDYARDTHRCRLAYRALGLSDDEIKDAIDFEFPDIAEPRFDTHLIGGMVTCSCGTTTSVAMIREDGNRMGRELTLRSFAFMDLTGEEYDAAMDFEFPELRTLVLDPVYSSVQVGCVCGEETPAAIHDAAASVHCICGRTWDVKVGVNAVLRHA